MPVVRLTDLPPPPPGKTGWPWTRGTPPLPATQANGAPWPRITVVTPSYNQGAFIEQTIRSVLLQGYPDVEYIVMDGGSSDATVLIMQKYARFLAHCRSEADRGQTDAINKGFAVATGKIRAYLNSDDFYLPGAFAAVAALFVREDCDIVVGRRQFGFNGFRPLSRSWWRSHLRPFTPPFIVHEAEQTYALPQDCVFWRAGRHQAGAFDASLQFCMDFDWFCRIFPDARVACTAQRLASVTLHDETKSARIYRTGWAERDRILERSRQETEGACHESVEAIRAEFAAAERRAWFRQFLPGRAPVFTYFHPPVPGSSAAPGSGARIHAHPVHGS